MLFSSPLFLFFFLPLFALLYGAVPRSCKNAVILAGSLFFYGWAEPTFIFVVIASALFDYIAASKIASNTNRSTRLSWMWLGIIANIGLLFYFKYAKFFVESASPLFAAAHLSKPVLNIYLPIGISFIVFEKITYVVDIYRGLGKPACSFFSYLVYVFFFPKLLAGPIIKYHDIAEQFDSRPHRFSDVESGFLRFLAGLAKKVLIADCLSGPADAIFKAGGIEAGSFYAWVGVICFTLQIYFDFSGYSDMAIGMSRMLGFSLRENFNMPYVARSFTDFWHRWHLSLSSWIREYLYIPLGGNRVCPLQRHLNLWICFLLSGLWHGASWTFVCWGFFHGLGLVCDKLAWLKLEPKLPKVVSTSMTLLMVMFGWVFFRANTFADSLQMIRAMFSFSAPTEFIYIGNDVWCMIVIGAFFSLVRPAELYNRIARASRKFTPAGALQLTESCGVITLLLLCLARASSNSFHPFLYFRF